MIYALLMTLVTLMTLMPALGSANATTVESYLRNREGVKKFTEKNYYPAYQAFLKALEEEPLSPEVQMNLARTFEDNEEYDKAEAGYKGALRLLPDNPSYRFQVLFNLATVLTKQQKIGEALAAYQECLDLVPESKEVKTNIELLWQGGGGGDGKSKKDDKDKDGKNKPQPKDGEGKQDQKPQPDDKKDQKKQPKSFESQDISPQDVKKILDEIKNQEQMIRAQEYERNGKEQGNAKDW